VEGAAAGVDCYTLGQTSRTPGAGRFLGRYDTTGEQELFHVVVAETKAEAQPDAMVAHLRGEAVALVRVGWYGGVYCSLRWVERHQERAFLSRGAIVEG
jgi:hypothetical protein